ncbi:MAG: hypothetical protein VX744_06635 [Candidatus Neomarinimicrobiota bacterium]|jgi:FtsZ-interacting cell division protein ZipA|nr:hypothetical protein [Candidatus Neomarinimicrobiota bacterium]|tara:strand:+ start:1659 stop:1997 length:339 start_codon:yes stop_codon:yes gene_type:complete
MTPQILILIIVAVILIYALSTHGQKEKSEADHIRDQFKMKKEASVNEDVVTYGHVQERKQELFDVIDANLGDHPTQSAQLKDIISDWADLKVKSFENRRSWVRNPNKDSESE